MKMHPFRVNLRSNPQQTTDFSLPPNTPRPSANADSTTAETHESAVLPSQLSPGSLVHQAARTAITNEQIGQRFTTSSHFGYPLEHQDENITSTPSVSAPTISTFTSSIKSDLQTSPPTDHEAAASTTVTGSTLHRTDPRDSSTVSELGYPKECPKIYCCTSQQLDPPILLRWEEELSERLKDEIDGLEGVFWTSRLCLARKPREKEFIPTIIILCNSHDEEINAQLRSPRLSNRRSYYRRAAKAGIRVQILLDSTSGPTGPATFSTVKTKAELICSKTDLEITCTTQSQPLSGRVVRLLELPSAHASFGGLIKIGDRLYGLTVAHPFIIHILNGSVRATSERVQKEIETEDDPVEACNSDSDSDSDSDTLDELAILSSCGILEDGAYPERINPAAAEAIESLMATTALNDNTGSVLDVHESLGTIKALGWRDNRYYLHGSHGTPFKLIEGFDTFPATDWALIELNDHFVKNRLFSDNYHLQLYPSSSLLLSGQNRAAWKDNDLHKVPEQQSSQAEPLPTLHQSGMIQDRNAGKACFGGSKSGYHTGNLSPSLTYVGIDGSTYSALQLELTEGIERGDSGSWVFREVLTQGSSRAISAPFEMTSLEAVGIVIAGASIIPTAYLLPIHRILQDIGVFLQVSATLPSWSDVFAIKSEIMGSKRAETLLSFGLCDPIEKNLIGCTNCFTQTVMPSWHYNNRDQPLCDPCGYYLKLHVKAPPPPQYPTLILRSDIHRQEPYEERWKVPPKEGSKRRGHYGEFVERTIDCFQMEYSLNKVCQFIISTSIPANYCRLWLALNEP